MHYFYRVTCKDHTYHISGGLLPLYILLLRVKGDRGHISAHACKYIPFALQLLVHIYNPERPAYKPVSRSTRNIYFRHGGIHRNIAPGNHRGFLRGAARYDRDKYSAIPHAQKLDYRRGTVRRVVFYPRAEFRRPPGGIYNRINHGLLSHFTKAA